MSKLPRRESDSAFRRTDSDRRGVKPPDSQANALRDALRCQEAEFAAGAPAFASVAARIRKEPSRIDAAPWTAAKSLRVAGELALSQLRIVPQTVLPAALIVTAAAVIGASMARYADSLLDATWLLSMILLASAALTATLALASERPDSIALATPVGPQTVTLVRLAAVLCIDAASGIAACAAASLAGVPIDLGALASAWLVPLAAVSGASAFIAVWTGSSWAGSIVGAASIPVVAPVAHAAADSGIGLLIAGLQGALGPVGIVVFGIALLAATVCSARRAAVARMQAA